MSYGFAQSNSMLRGIIGTKIIIDLLTKTNWG